MVDLTDFPELRHLIAAVPVGSFLETLLDFRANGDRVPLLEELEQRLGALRVSGWAVTSETRSLLSGPELSFFSGVAEVVALAWLARRGFLRAVGLAMPAGESVKGATHVLDAVLGVGKTADVLADIKSVQAHVQRYLDEIRKVVASEFAVRGRGELRLDLHVSGAPDVTHVRENLAKIVARARRAVPKMLARETVYFSRTSGLRLRARAHKRAMQGGFSSMDGEILRQQEYLWSRCHQLSTRRPFLLVLARTPGMGIDTGSLGDLLGRALVGDKGGTTPIFGSTSTKVVPKVGMTKAALQRHLSAVLFIDELAWGKESVRLYVNRHAAHPLPRRFVSELKKNVTEDRRRRRADRSDKLA